jgi:hypothetical protein
MSIYENVKRSLKFQYDNDIEDQTKFVQTLPQDLKLIVSLFIYESIYKHIDYLQNRPMMFLAQICPLLLPMIKEED